MTCRKAVQSACGDLKGSFALEIICKDYPDNMIVVRKDSPLVIGKGDGENYISSDIPAILSFTKDFYLLNDYEFALLSKDKIEFYDIDLNKINKKVNVIDWSASAADKNGYDDYMLKEIFEQPNAIRETIGSRLPENEPCNFEDLNFSKEFLLFYDLRERIISTLDMTHLCSQLIVLRKHAQDCKISASNSNRLFSHCFAKLGRR